MYLISYFIDFLKTKFNWNLSVQIVPHRNTLCLGVIKTGQLMLNREIISVCSEIHTKRINTLCGQNVELRVKQGGT